LSKQFRGFNRANYNEKMVKNYLEGMLWCLEMYSTGICPKYDYVYEYKTSPTPSDINYYLTMKGHNINISKSDALPIDIKYYTLLVMPKKARSLVPTDYQQYIDNELKYLYKAYYHHVNHYAQDPYILQLPLNQQTPEKYKTSIPLRCVLFSSIPLNLHLPIHSI